MDYFTNDFGLRAELVLKGRHSASQFEFHTILWIGGVVCRALLQRPKSTLDYLMFLFYKPGLNLQSKETRNSIGTANFKELE